MGRDLNMATFIGRLTRDPETKYTQSGKCLCNMTIAIGCDYYNSEKQKVEETTFADITIWGKQAENCSKYLRKGSQVCVNGRLKTERWVDNTTQKNRNKNQEIKQDDGKIDYTLLDWGAIRKLVEVREYGVKKYNKRDSWQEVSKERYIKALLRHVIAYADREENDKESGLNHLAHAMCNCMFILSGKLKEGKK